MSGCCNGVNTARDSGKREEQLVHLLQAAPPNSTSGFVSNGSHAALILAHVGLHVGAILRHESYSEDQGVLHVSLTWIFAALEASLRTGGVQPFGSIGVSVDF